MCFSAPADVVVGAALVPVAVLSLRKVRHWREVPFAALPAIFAVHQFTEAPIWNTGQGWHLTPSAVHVAVLMYLVIALPLLPALVPLSVLLLEPRGRRLRVAPFVALGLVVSAYLAFVVQCKPVGVVVHPHALEYRTGIQSAGVWVTLYIVAVIGPALLSGYRSIVAFGAVNLVGLAVVAVLYAEAFTSVWCVYAAAASALVWMHMIRRRRVIDSAPCRVPAQSAAHN